MGSMVGAWRSKSADLAEFCACAAVAVAAMIKLASSRNFTLKPLSRVALEHQEPVKFQFLTYTILRDFNQIGQFIAAVLSLVRW